MTPAALGFRAHSGWAAAVALAGPPRSSVVIERRRIELVDKKTPDSVQPYHAAAKLEFREAEKWVKHCADRAQFLAWQSMQAFIHRPNEPI